MSPDEQNEPADETPSAREGGEDEATPAEARANAEGPPATANTTSSPGEGDQAGGGDVETRPEAGPGSQASPGNAQPAPGPDGDNQASFQQTRPGAEASMAAAHIPMPSPIAPDLRAEPDK